LPQGQAFDNELNFKVSFHFSCKDKIRIRTVKNFATFIVPILWSLYTDFGITTHYYMVEGNVLLSQ